MDDVSTPTTPHPVCIVWGVTFTGAAPAALTDCHLFGVPYTVAGVVHVRARSCHSYARLRALRHRTHTRATMQETHEFLEARGFPSFRNSTAPIIDTWAQRGGNKFKRMQASSRPKRVAYVAPCNVQTAIGLAVTHPCVCLPAAGLVREIIHGVPTSTAGIQRDTE